jgi:hypothetical protein
MKRSLALCTALASLVAVAAALVLQAGGQPPATTAPPPGVVVESREDGTLVERTVDGKILRTAEGNAAPRIYQVVEEKGPDGKASTRYVLRGGWQSAYGPVAADAQSQKLLAQEQTAAQEARTLVTQALQADSDGAKADAKKKLRDKLAQVFELQQTRRNHEIAKIEERLAKLKDTLKKRESSKDSIIDRRLETLTGGVDELGWEDNFPETLSPQGYGFPGVAPAPTGVPRYAPPAEPVPGPAGPVPSPPRVPGVPGVGAPAAAPVPVPALPSAGPTPPVVPLAPSPSQR